MLDRRLVPLLTRPLDGLAALLAPAGAPASGPTSALPSLALTLLGFGLGLAALPQLQLHHYRAALACLLAGRLLDALGGAITRRQGPRADSAYSAWLRLVCEAGFMASFVLGMTLALPDHAFWSVLGLVSLMSAWGSALAYAAVTRALPDPDGARPLARGLIERSETLLFVIACCLLPHLYPTLAIAFSALCLLTVLIRLVTVARSLEGSAG